MNRDLDLENNSFIIHKKDEEVASDQFDESEVVEEVLSLENMEKVLISKALIKHSGRRKDASDEFGISERRLDQKE